MAKSGITPANARIVGLLLVSAATKLTFEQIMDTLQISKRSTSNALNKLLSIRQIEYVTKHGDRKKYFHVVIEQWYRKMAERLEGMMSMNTLFKEIMETVPKTTKAFNENLQERNSYMDFFNNEILSATKKWKS